MGALVANLYEVKPGCGSISIDGIDVGTMDPTWMRQHIASVGQEPVLFHGTIAENIAYGKPDASQEEVQRCAEMANAHQFISSLPQGYSTMVGERGQSLSGGQKQRIAIARALIRNPTILVSLSVSVSLTPSWHVLTAVAATG